MIWSFLLSNVLMYINNNLVTFIYFWRFSFNVKIRSWKCWKGPYNSQIELLERNSWCNLNNIMLAKTKTWSWRDFLFLASEVILASILSGAITRISDLMVRGILMKNGRGIDIDNNCDRMFNILGYNGYIKFNFSIPSNII